jgi:acetyl-CoA acetyltransferase family protein
MPTRTAVIVDAVRTAGGKRNGRLSGWHPADLAGEVLRALTARSDLDPALVDDVIVGCATQIGDQALNVARSAVLGAGFPESVPGTSVDRQASSSLQAIHFAAQGVVAGAYDVVVAAGVECMSTTPAGATLIPGSTPYGPRVMERYAPEGGLVPLGISAELVAERFGLTRDELDAFALRSHRRAERATTEGRFAAEIVAVEGRVRDRETGAVTVLADPLTVDEDIRPGLTADALAALKPEFSPDGVVTAGNRAPVGDGAAAVLIASDRAAERLGLPARARFVAFAVAGVDPLLALTGPIPASVAALHRARLGLAAVDVVEIDEAFAAAVLAWEQELGGDPDRVNRNGGAIALGHPLGSSGARLTATLLHELGRRGGRYGLAAVGGAGGTANAAVIERLG